MCFVVAHGFNVFRRIRPSTWEHLSAIVYPRVRQALARIGGTAADRVTPIAHNNRLRSGRAPWGDTGALASRAAGFPRLTQWTLSKKGHLEQLLELDLRETDSSWLWYLPEEQRLKGQLSDDLWRELLDEALAAMLTPHSAHSVDG